MSEASPRIPEYVAVECPVCYTRMHARPAKIPGTIKCPDCYTLARVPTIAEVLARLPRVRAPEAIGTYDLGAATNPAVDDAPPDWPSTGSYQLQARLSEPRDVVTAPPLNVGAAFSPPVAPPPVAPPPEPRAPERRGEPLQPPRGRGREKPARAAAETPPSSSTAPPVTVACPTCGAEIEPLLSDEPQTILCPDCLEDVAVPARRDLAAPDRPRSNPKAETVPPRERPRVVQEPVTKPALAPVRSEPPEQPRRSRTKRGAPGRTPPAASPPPPAAAPPPVEDEPIEFAEAADPQPPTSHVNIFEALAEIRQEKRDPPPRWTFFSSVFGFPWRPDMVMRWVYLTLGFTVFGLVLSGFLLLAEFASWLLVLVVFLPVLVAAAGLTLSYSAACFLPILVDTSYGNDRVTGWFDSDWKEWSVQFMYLVCMLLAAGLAGHVAGVIAEPVGGPYGLVLGVTMFLSFPIIVLSSQEANSPLMPVTLPILKSLVTCAWGWLMFYGLSGLVVGAATVLVGLLSEVSPYVAFLASGPILATVCLIYPRLLGRLAWRASLAGPRRRKRRRMTNLPLPAGGFK
ncbi:MAG TPA: hypothetical protein VML55_15285 [Planctomycetaceae bacterium]|nr:hypothetical protein [Planctomycetaceae bacterium]